MKRTIFFSIVAIALLFVIWKIASFKMFEVEDIKLATHEINGKNYSVEIRYEAAGATTIDVLQVRRVYNSGKFDIIKNIENYNTLVSSNIIGDSLLRLTVTDTGYYKRGPDTLLIKIE